MNSTFEKYFMQDEEGYYYNIKNKEYLLKGVTYSGDRTRNAKASEQAKLEPVPLGKVYSYINEFLELIREDNGYTEKNIKIDVIELDGIKHLIIDNGIIITTVNNWAPSHWNDKKKIYDKYDKKYDDIKKKFDLERVSDLLWFKFTDKGHLAVVASSCDINWDNSLSCGILVDEVEQKFDDSFVFVFPLTRHMIRRKTDLNSIYRKYTISELELAVGNYLIDKGVPIVDYYSHMGYKYNGYNS